jgi:hypothetical protein
VSGDPLDDVADDARYGIYTFITTTEKPLEIRMAETLRPLAEAGDLSSAYIRGLQMTAEAQASYRVRIDGLLCGAPILTCYRYRIRSVLEESHGIKGCSDPE